MKAVVSLVSAVIAGLLLVLAYPPTGWVWLLVPAVALFLASIRYSDTAWAAWLGGGLFGLSFFGLLFPWIGELGLIALLPLVVVQAAYPTLYAGLLYRARRWDVGPWVGVAIGGWALMEYLRARFPLGGFGWGILGYPVGEWEAARNAAQWIGTSGWSVVVVALAAALAVGSVRYLALTASLVVGLVVLGWLFPVTTNGEEVVVAIVQGSSPCPGTHCPDERIQIYEKHLELTRTLDPPLDLLVWPEGSTGSFNADPVLVPEVRAAMQAEARRLGAVFLAGGDRPISDTEWVNANVVIDRDGEILGEYRKQHPVPFGEYIPARPWFEWIPALSQVPRDMVKGLGPVLFSIDGGELGSVISFESSFARYGRENVSLGADLLVVATSQASYPYSNASDQLIGMTRMRAAELGVDVVHVSVSGRSVLITDGGLIGERTPLSEPAVLTGTVQLRTGPPTLYVRWGDWVQAGAILAGLTAMLNRARRRSKGLVTDEAIEGEPASQR